MKINNLIFIIFILFTPVVTQAQLEAAVWSVGAGLEFNFKSGSFELTTFDHNKSVNATICDKEGNLILFSDGYSIWNGKNELLINGENLIEESNIPIPGAQPVFIPYPNKNGYYLLIYESAISSDHASFNFKDKKVMYAEINVNAGAGRGEVISKNKKIHSDYHSSFTVAGYCNNSYFWLLIDSNDNVNMSVKRDRIFFYKIDENGVNLTPFINDDIDIGNSNGYKFSPNGDKFNFVYQENSGNNLVNAVADFNFTKGEMYNIRQIGSDLYYQNEFSPDSKLFYFFSGVNLIQLNVDYISKNLINKSRQIVHVLESDENNLYPGGDLQIAPDGKIYFYYYDIHDKATKLGRINNPNKSGDSCNVELNLETVNSGYPFLPEFVTSFFRDNQSVILDEIKANAGPDLVLCPKSRGKLGGNSDFNANFHWYLEDYLEDPFSAITTFSTPFNQYTSEILNRTLRVTDGNCWVNFDNIEISISPIPQKLPIDGSWSVCPFVEEVEYWTVKDGNKLQWLVNGGEIASNPSGDRVKINWRETNFDASASVFSTNTYGCISDTSVFPVRINVELITETPKGPNKICIAKSANVEYQIRNTNGSVYEWFPEAGEVVSGQGTNKIAVNWHGAGQHKITVEETSVTIDTICFGESIPLIVEIINDSLDIELQNVSYNLQNNLVINYDSDKLQNHKHSLYLRKQNEFGDVSEMIISDLYDGDVTVTPISNTINSEIISLKVTNSCAEMFLSNQLQTIVLKGFNDEFQNLIKLNWNINQFWENDKIEHEIWHSANGNDGWKMVEKIGSETEFVFQINELSLTHFFRINEINRGKNLESWSNTIKIEVKDELIIPDVFTPNGDGINDEWEIKNIYFHSFQEVRIYNRHGEKVYECKNEFIPWDGKINGEIFQGTYFYQITFSGENIRNGQVTILQ